MRLVEDKTRVAEAESHSSKNDDNALKDDEGDLVLDQITIITLTELSNTIDASSEDKDDGSRETSKEGSLAPAESLGMTRSPVSNHVIREGSDEDDKDDNLEDKTGHRDINTNIAIRLGRHGTTSSLEDEADDIEGDEDPVEQCGLEARELGAEEVDCLGEGDIDGSGIEDGSDREADNLDHESVEGEGVVPHHDTTDIANNLRDAAKKHTSHETPTLPSEAKICVDKTNETEENDEDNVGSKRRSVAVDTPLNRASIQVTGRIGAEGIFGPDGVIVRHIVG